LELEERFSAHCNVKYCAAVNSGTAALHSALYVAGLRPGDEVITTPFTFIATANSILMMGAKPIFVDIDDKTFNLNTNEIEKKINIKTKAILPVHLYGLMADMNKINIIAKRNNLVVIEDAAQAHSAEINNQKAGSYSDLGAFSLYATKNMMSAEGGLITSNNKEYIERIKSFRHHGQSPNKQYNYIDFGYNYRMSDIHASIALNQLKMLEKYTQMRIENANIYNNYLKDIPGITLPYIPQGFKHVFHQYTIKIDSTLFGCSRDRVIKELNENKIFPGIFYPRPLHLIPIFKKYGYMAGDFPVSERICNEVISLPVHPSVEGKDIIRICEIIRKFKK
jgi:perosamine synthetase